MNPEAGSEFERGRQAGRSEGAARTIAQMFCLVVGGGLVAAGVLGFFFGGSSFDTDGAVQGEDFIVFEVNGWHNTVHVASGALLLLLAPSARLAAAGAAVFGVLYAGVAAWGFIDGADVAGLLSINTADNWLHVALAALGLLAAGMSGAFAANARRRGKAGPGAFPGQGSGGGPTALRG